jgi:alkylated DNA repair dioxygenase AlkB
MLLPRPDIEYVRHFYSPDEADELFLKLRNETDWRQDQIKIYGKWIDQPRLTAWYADDGKHLHYSGITMHANPWTDTLLSIKAKVEQYSGFTFNSVLLNLYRNGNDSVGWHSDDEHYLGKNPVIASVSFGQPRKMLFRMRKDTGIKSEMVLGSGSLLLMKGNTQHVWHHSIPKTKKPLEERINLTFRTIF